MTWIRFAVANLLQSSLASAVNIMLMALGTASIVVLILAGERLTDTLSRDARGVDLVVGAEGSPAQLILSSVYHADIPTGNIPLRAASELAEDPRVAIAAPVSLGDSFRGFRIVGTNPDFLEMFGATLAEGSVWAEPLQAVLGAAAAQASGLTLGDRFFGSHGFSEGGHTHDTEAYEVVGVLAPLGSVVDRLVLTSLESVWTLHGQEGASAHDHHSDDDHHHSDVHGDEDHDSDPHHAHDHADDHHSDEHDDEHGHEHDEDVHQEEDEHHHDDHHEEAGHQAHGHSGDEDHGDHDHDHDHDDHHEGERHHEDGHSGDPHHDEDHHAHGPAADNGHDDHTDEHDSHDHSDEHRGHSHDNVQADDLEVTAVLVRYQTPLAATTLPGELNRAPGLISASPALEITRILQLVGLGLEGLRAFAWVLVIAASLSVFAALYGSLQRRQGDLAMLRCLGATRLELFFALMSEGLILSSVGIFLGYVLGHGAMGIASGWLEASRGVSLAELGWAAAETQLLFVLLGVSLVSAAIPSIRAYRYDVAQVLAENRS